MLAIFDNLGFSELMIVLVAAVLIFGKRLPEVAAQAGQQLAKFRRSLQDIKNETGIDNDLRKIQRDLQDAVPRELSMGEMARIASIELEKRMMANDEPKKPSSDASPSGAGSSVPAASSSPAPPPDAAHRGPASDAAHRAPATDADAHDAGGRETSGQATGDPHAHHG
jgi:Sec-independent protein translocase protein TatA